MPRRAGDFEAGRIASMSIRSACSMLGQTEPAPMVARFEQAGIAARLMPPAIDRRQDKVVLDQARPGGADLLIMDAHAHGHGRLWDASFADATRHVATEAAIPVLLLR